MEDFSGNSPYSGTPFGYSGSPISPSSYSVGSPNSSLAQQSRLRRLGGRLSFWRRRVVTIEDVIRNLQNLIKAHQTYQEAMLKVATTFNRWAIEQPENVPIRPLLLRGYEESRPLWQPDPTLYRLLDDIVRRLQELRVLELGREHATKLQLEAERKYYKAMYHGAPSSIVDPLERQSHFLTTQMRMNDRAFRKKCVEVASSIMRDVLQQMDTKQAYLLQVLASIQVNLDNFHAAVSDTPDPQMAVAKLGREISSTSSALAASSSPLAKTAHDHPSPMVYPHCEACQSMADPDLVNAVKELDICQSPTRMSEANNSNTSELNSENGQSEAIILNGYLDIDDPWTKGAKKSESDVRF